MSKRKIITVALLGLFICSLLLLVPVQPVQPEIQKGTSQFVLAGWDYPDEYWQGIKGINVYQNSSGAWVLSIGTIEPDEETTFDWNASLCIKLRVWVDLNKTLVRVSTTNEGKNYLRLNVTVSTSMDDIVFSQQNFTYFGASIEDDIYTYSYDVVLNFLPLSSEIYTATITYEVFY